MDDSADNAVYIVVVNGEGQYAIWPADKGAPEGWRDVGTRGDKAACLGHIEQVWTDMRPASLRKAMDDAR